MKVKIFGYLGMISGILSLLPFYYYGMLIKATLESILAGGTTPTLEKMIGEALLNFSLCIAAALLFIFLATGLVIRSEKYGEVQGVFSFTHAIAISFGMILLGASIFSYYAISQGLGLPGIEEVFVEAWSSEAVTWSIFATFLLGIFGTSFGIKLLRHFKNPTSRNMLGGIAAFLYIISGFIFIIVYYILIIVSLGGAVSITIVPIAIDSTARIQFYVNIMDILSFMLPLFGIAHILVSLPLIFES